MTDVVLSIATVSFSILLLVSVCWSLCLCCMLLLSRFSHAEAATAFSAS